MKKGLFHSRSAYRAVATILIAVVLLTLLSSGAFAQNASNQLKVGETVTGTLDAKTFSQMYTFDGAPGDTFTITATSKTRGLTLALILSDSAGQILNQVAELSKPEVTIKDFKPAVAGIYYVTVLRATGVQGNTVAQFTLALTGTTKPVETTKTVELAQGMSVVLSWNTSDDLNLEVRDPVGGAANRNNTTVPSGGSYVGDTNADCATASADGPTETVSWPPGPVPAGSYEIIIYYVTNCSGNTNPVDFSVTVTVNGVAQDPIRGSLGGAGQQYVASFNVSAPDQVQVSQGGPNLSVDLTPLASQLANPKPLNANGQATGVITAANPGDVYAVDLKANETVTISMKATSGSLDPLLLLVNNNQLVTSNDDENENTRNALITAKTTAAGQYLIVATRFAIANGGTEGSYTLTIKTTTGGVAATLAPGATAEATQSVIGVATTVATNLLPKGSIEALLSWNTRADIRLLVRDPQGRSVYTDVPRIDSGGVMYKTGNLNCKNTTSTPQNYIYWNTLKPPPGVYEVKVFQNSDCDDPAPASLDLNVTVAGKSVIAQTGMAPVADKTVYLTTFKVDDNGNAVAGQGGIVTDSLTVDISGSVSAALPITFGQTVTGEIVYPTISYQLYSFNAIAGDKVTITMKRLSNNLDSMLYLMTGDGKTQLASNDDTKATGLGTGDAQIKYNIVQDGTYIIVATRYGVQYGGTQGRYSLQLAR